MFSEQSFKQQLIMLGLRVKQLRTEKSMTLNELSQKSGISTNYLKKIENGQAVGINTKHLDRLRKGFKLKSLDKLLNF